MIDVDAAKLPLMLTTLRLPTISRIWQEFGGRADREGWGSARFLAALCEHELADRQARRIARHMAESGLPQGKSFATFDFAAVPTTHFVTSRYSRAVSGQPCDGAPPWRWGSPPPQGSSL